MGSETRARLALAGLLLATLGSFTRLFAGDAFFGPALLGAVLSTAIAMVARRTGARSSLAAAVSCAVLFWYLAIVFESRHLLYGLPTPAAARGLARSVAQAWVTSSVDFAPVPARPGYVIMLVTAMWMLAALAEAATFRWRRPLLASLGPIVAVSFVLVVGSARGSSLVVLLFLAALLTFWGVESSHRLRSWGRWVTPWAHRSDEPESLTGALARRMGASCLAAALLAPLLLPALDQGLLSWRTGVGGTGEGAGTGRSVNLLVSLAPTLVNRSEQELLRVRADAPTYWRLTSLAAFDGRDWKPDDANFIPVTDGAVRTYREVVPRVTRMTQRFTITGLVDDILPAAAEPAAIALDADQEREAQDVTVDPDTGELRLAGGLVEGLRYEVVSEVPNASYRALSRATIGDPGPEFTQLPEDLSPELSELVERWTAGEDTAFQRLVAVQERLRAFDYSLEVEPGHSADYLTRFLTETRAGYCQQFATAFAVLARLQGLPSRVSVGFLPGALAPDGSTHIVTGNHAHAWPEIYFEEFGWVPFEPTPRADVTQPSYTLAGFSSPGGGPGAPGPGGGSAVRGIGNNPAARDGSNPFQPQLQTGEVPSDLADRPLDLAWAETFARLARTLLAATLLFLIAVPLLKEWRIVRRYRAARAPAEAAAAAFAHFESEASELARARRASESAVAFARELAAANRTPKRASLALGRLYERSQYAAAAPSARQASEARALARQLRGALWSSASWWERGVRLFSPATLLPARSRRSRARSARARVAIATGVARAGRP